MYDLRIKMPEGADAAQGAMVAALARLPDPTIVATAEERLILPVVRESVDEIRDKMKPMPDKLAAYLNAIQDSIMGDLPRFRSSEEPGVQVPGLPSMGQADTDDFVEYKVNVLVDNSQTTGVPFIIETNPRFKNANGPNYRLGGASTLANAAESCVPGLVLPRGDAGGRFRYFGAGLDIGAFERGSTVLGSAKGVSKTGTNGRNKLKGGTGRDVLCGMGGNDTLLGLGGNDFLFGGLGADKASGGAGNDRIELRDGKKGNDSGDGGSGQDVCLLDARDKRTSC